MRMVRASTRDSHASATGLWFALRDIGSLKDDDDMEIAESA